MNQESISVHCPYCGEFVEVDVEPWRSQSLLKIAASCCRPMQLEATPGEDG